jgi:hypothetical protein
VRTELAKIYREGRSGARSASDVSRLANVLAVLLRVIEIERAETSAKVNGAAQKAL